MGGPASPKVFQTTPPHPASKARRTLYSLSVGGAEASQNGFGDLMPMKSVDRLAMASLLAARCEQGNGAGSTLTRSGTKRAWV
jgi:hypothetical protein